MVYKWCIVPQCTNTSIKSPHKVFVSVPKNPKRRKLWLQLAGRVPNSIVSHSTVFMCEDHFDMEKDIMNYMKYKMGFSKNRIVSNEAVPTKFQCQEDHNRLLSEDGSTRDEFLNTFTAAHVTDSEGRCPMIEIPLSTKQFALPAGFEAVGLSLSSDEDPDNTSLYCEDDSVSEQNTRPLGENSMFKGFQCSVCDIEIVGFRYTCVQCSDLDLCGACEAARAHHHHYVLRVPADRHAEETETVLTTIRLHLMKDLDPIAELEPDPGKSVKLEIKSESEEEVNITLEQEEFHNVATHDLIIPDTKIIDESMVLPIEINEIEDPQVPLNVSTMESEMTSEIEPTNKPTATKRKICATKMQQNTKKGMKVCAVPSASSGIDTNVLSAESPSATKFEVLQLPPPPATGPEQVQKICIPSDLSNNTRVYSYNKYRVAPDCTVRLSRLPDSVLDVQRTSSQPPSNKSNSAAEDKR